MAESNIEKTVHGVVAEFTTVDSLLAACRRVRDAGYTKTDAFTPFPVHGIDKALGIKPTVLPWIALGAGVSGTAIAFLMQIWMNGIDYPYIISGKPYISLPAFVPVGFELTILLASFGTFFGMWALNGLPRFSNPMFTNSRFDRATDDTFFLYVDAKDPRYEQSGVEQLLADTGGEHIERVVEDDSPNKIPRFLILGWASTVALSLIPLLIVAQMRVTTSRAPRFHIFPDMDLSPSKDAQQTTTLFADFRAARPDVPGTVARGDGGGDLNFLSGVDVKALSRLDRAKADRLVAHFAALNPGPWQDEHAEPGATSDSADDAAADPSATAEVDNTPWVQENPVELTREVFERGREKFNIYCVVCHGPSGRGNGLVNQRAQQILATTWTPPSNIVDPALGSDQYPDGKLFSTITNGVRKMSGYASQISARDRWAIVAYVRALQLSQNAELDMVPESERAEIAAEKSKIDQQLAEAAEAERQRQAEANKEPTP